MCLIFVALALSPVTGVAVGRAWDFGSAYRYIWENSLLVIRQWDVSGSPSGVPFPGVWNGSLWTLSYEFGAYLCTAALFSLPVARRRPIVVSALLLAGLVAGQLMAPRLGVTTNVYLNILWLGTFYAAGALLWSLSSKIKVSPLLVVTAAILVVVSATLEAVDTLGAVPFVLILLTLGALLPVRLGSKNDVSYGVYIYAFPMQQTLTALSFPSAAGLVAYAVLSFILTVPLAWASWRFIERPCLALKPRRVKPTVAFP
jgi:peptidoglycan/LPS O-acetylase OafA/YrhL